MGKFSDRIFEEFLKIKEVSLAYLQMSFKRKINLERNKQSGWIEANNFYMMDSTFGYDQDGRPVPEENESSELREEIKAMMLNYHNCLNIKEELNGTGYGFVFLKELKELFDTYTNVSIIFESILYECKELFGIEDFILTDKIQTFRIMWNFYSDYFIDNPFVIKFLTQLKTIFAIYKQDDVVKYIHDLVLVRWNIYEILTRIKKKLEKIIGPEEIMDEKEKFENMNNDDVLKYIEGDEKPKKKKKKKKKNKINMLEELANKYGEQNNIIDDELDEDEFEDGLSMISEADSVLNSFKKDIMAETEYNTGSKIAPTLSSTFLNDIQK